MSKPSSSSSIPVASGAGRGSLRPPVAASSPVVPPLKSVKLLDRVRECVRLLHYSLRTEEAYVHWCRAFIRILGLPHLGDMGRAKVEGLIKRPATRRPYLHQRSLGNLGAWRQMERAEARKNAASPSQTITRPGGPNKARMV